MLLLLTEIFFQLQHKVLVVIKPSAAETTYVCTWLMLNIIHAVLLKQL